MRRETEEWFDKDIIFWKARVVEQNNQITERDSSGFYKAEGGFLLRARDLKALAKAKFMLRVAKDYKAEFFPK